MLPFIGERVVRGPDWEYNDDDGGDGCVGTVIAIKKDTAGNSESNNRTRTNSKIEKVTVAWDLGQIGDYRTGLDGKYDLACVDVGLGRPHILAQCDECACTPTGYRWFCMVCSMYDLCDTCYNRNKHHLDHQFARFSTSIGSFVRAPTRESSLSVRLEARGLFVGAKVSKDGKHGVVRETLSFRDKQQWGAVKVLWDGEQEAVLHARTEDGTIDIKCEETAKYGEYYKDHLANLGERNYNLVGDLASVLTDVEKVKELQEGHGDWIPQMTESLRQVAIIVAVTYKGDCKLHFPVLGLEWDFNTEAVTRLEEFGIGDTVRLITDEEKVKKFQPGHGDWKDEMSQDLGQEGTVLTVQRTGDIKVLVNGHPWTLHPACVTLVRAEDQRSLTEWEEAQQLIMLKAMQDELILGRMGVATSSINAMKVDILKFVQNANEGNLAGVKEALEKNPSWTKQREIGKADLKEEAWRRRSKTWDETFDKVNIQVSKKTALHVACDSGHLEVVKYLISKDAYLEVKDEKGFRPLHCAIFSKKPKVVEYLLKQGAYASAVNNIGLSPLHLAALKGFADSTAVLLKHGCNINVQDQCGDVALHFAIVGESRECQKLLVESPMADLTLRNYKGYNALHFAALRNSEVAVNMILDKIPALAQNRNEDGLTSLHIAALTNNSTIAQILIEKGRCTIDVLSYNSATPLFLAVSKGATETVEVLVTHGAIINLPSKSGMTCMHAILELVKDPQCEVEDSLTLRKIRASMREIGVSSPGGALACYLVRNGGRLDIPDKEGTKPIDLVVDPKLKECLEKCLATSSPRRSPAPAAKKERNPILSRILPFLSKDRGVRKKPPSGVEGLDEVQYIEEEQVELSINPFKIGDELPKSPLEDLNVDAISPDQIVTDEDLKANVEKAAEHACSTCGEQLTQLIGIPCQHVQTWPGEEVSALPSAAIQKAEPPKRVVSALRRQNSEFRSALACTVCFQRKKGVVFECGHSTCKECAELLPECPVCRKPASKVFPLYL